jgi:hypothetical protein
MAVSEEEHALALRARADGQAVTAVGRIAEREGRRTLLGRIVGFGDRAAIGIRPAPQEH